MAWKVWLEMALNGPWSQEVQPNIPIRVDETVDEGIACAKDGAGIVHVHAYDESKGRQRRRRRADERPEALRGGR